VKAPSLPVVFVGAVLVSAAAIGSYLFIQFGSTLVPRVRAHPGATVYFALASLMTATLVVFVTVVVREARRAKRPEMAEYRHALETGQTCGDVSHWSDWIRHDRKVNLWRAGAAVCTFVLGVMGLVGGGWWNGWMIAVAVWWVREYWRTRRRLTTLAARADLAAG